MSHSDLKHVARLERELADTKEKLATAQRDLLAEQSRSRDLRSDRDRSDQEIADLKLKLTVNENRTSKLERRVNDIERGLPIHLPLDNEVPRLFPRLSLRN